MPCRHLISPREDVRSIHGLDVFGRKVWAAGTNNLVSPISHLEGNYISPNKNCEYRSVQWKNRTILHEKMCPSRRITCTICH